MLSVCYWEPQIVDWRYDNLNQWKIKNIVIMAPLDTPECVSDIGYTRMCQWHWILVQTEVKEERENGHLRIKYGQKFRLRPLSITVETRKKYEEYDCENCCMTDWVQETVWSTEQISMTRALSSTCKTEQADLTIWMSFLPSNPMEKISPNTEALNVNT